MGLESQFKKKKKKHVKLTNYLLLIRTGGLGIDFWANNFYRLIKLLTAITIFFVSLSLRKFIEKVHMRRDFPWAAPCAACDLLSGTEEAAASQ